MSRPRFLADNDVKESIVDGVTRREPSIEFARARELGLRRTADPAILAYAAEHGWVVVSHDVNTMSAAAIARMAAGEVLSGLSSSRSHVL